MLSWRKLRKDGSTERFKMGFIDTFERKEVKHVLTASQYAAIQHALKSHMAIDAYGKTTITSVYYDTPSWDLIERSLEKPLYKEKLRVRLYGSLEDKDSPAFVEVKKKYKGIVYKRRVCMTQPAVAAYFGGATYEQAQMAYPLGDEVSRENALSAKNLQIAGEIGRFCEFHGPIAPSMIISVQRSAWAPIEGANADFATDNLRITFDEDVKYCNLREAHPSYRNLLEPGVTIMEVKAMGAMPAWLVSAMSELKIFPSSFSKYGEAYKTVMATGHPHATNRRRETRGAHATSRAHAAHAKRGAHAAHATNESETASRKDIAC